MIGYLTMSDRSSSTAAAFFRFSIHILRIAYCYWFSIRMMNDTPVCFVWWRKKTRCLQLSGPPTTHAWVLNTHHPQQTQDIIVISFPGFTNFYGRPIWWFDEDYDSVFCFTFPVFLVFPPGFSLPLQPLFSLANGEKIGDGARCGLDGWTEWIRACVGLCSE